MIKSIENYLNSRHKWPQAVLATPIILLAMVTGVSLGADLVSSVQHIEGDWSFVAHFQHWSGLVLCLTSFIGGLIAVVWNFGIAYENA